MHTNISLPRTTHTPPASTCRPNEASAARENAAGLAIAAFSRSLEAKNRSAATLRAYAADLRQLFAWLGERTAAAEPDRVARGDIIEYFAALGRQGLTGTTRARKLAAVREFFRFLEETEAIRRSPCIGVETPKKEQRLRTFLRPDEYARMLALAGASARDFAILQVFLQTGVRVGELCALTVANVDLSARTLTVRAGEGHARPRDRARAQGRPGHPRVAAHPARRAVGRALPEQGRLGAERAGRAGPRRPLPHCRRHHPPRHAAQPAPHIRHPQGGAGREPLPAQRWLGHSSLNTTQLYVHLGRHTAQRVMEATSL